MQVASYGNTMLIGNTQHQTISDKCINLRRKFHTRGVITRERMSKQEMLCSIFPVCICKLVL